MPVIHKLLLLLLRTSLILLFATCGFVSGSEVESKSQIVFSSRRWEGEFFTSDIPGEVGRTEVTGAIYRINSDGTGLLKIIELGGRTEYPVPGPDGEWVYFQSNVTGRSQVYRCHWDGSRVTNLTEGNPLGAEWSESFGITLSADGKQLLYTVHNGEMGRVVIANADGSKPRFVAPQLGYTYMAAISPQGNQIVFSGPARGYRLLIADLPEREPRLLTPEHPESFAPQFTPDGNSILFFRRDGDLYRVDRDGMNLRRMTEGNHHVEFRLSKKDQHGSTDGPQLSPDGKTIAYMVDRDGVSNIHLIGVEGDNHRQLTSRLSSCGRPRWSPDGKQIAFVSFIGESKYPQLFVIDVQGGEPRQVTNLDEAVYFPQWCPIK